VIPIGTIKALRAWSRWGESLSIDYPSFSPMFGERALKTPLYGKTHCPDGIAEMEHAVCMLSYDQRYLIVQYWCRRRTFGQLAEQVGVSRFRIHRMLKAAEAEVHRQYELVFELKGWLSVC
jgi:hypothetical protein